MNAAARAEELEVSEARRALSSPDGLREQIQDIISGGESQAKVAREAGIGASSLNQWLSGGYRGNNDRLEHKLILWLDNRDRRLAMTALLPEPPSWIDTPTGKKIHAALSFAQAGGDMALVYGNAGTGKTSAFVGYRERNPNVWIATVSPSTSSLGGVLQLLCMAITNRGVAHSVSLRSLDLRNAIANKGGLLIIDEAQHLSIPAIEEIRSIHDETNVGICFAGNDIVYSRLAGEHKSKALAQIYSRIGMRVKLTIGSPADVRAIARAWEIESGDMLKFLEALARKPGSLRNVNKTIRLAAMFARTNGNQMALEHLESAWQNLSASA